MNLERKMAVAARPWVALAIFSGLSVIGTALFLGLSNRSAPVVSTGTSPAPVPTQPAPVAQPTYNPGAPVHRTAAVAPATQQSPIIAPTQSAAPVSQSAAPVETAQAAQPAVHHQAAAAPDGCAEVKEIQRHMELLRSVDTDEGVHQTYDNSLRIAKDRAKDNGFTCQ